MRRYDTDIVIRIIVDYLDISAYFFFFKQKTAYEMRISDWSSDVCSSDLIGASSEAALSRKTKFPFKSAATACFALSSFFIFSTGCHQIGRASCRERVCQYV